MATTVDRELLQLYVLGELDDAASARVEALVADDPAWAKALQAEAQLEMAIYEVVDAAPQAVAAPQQAPAREPAKPWWSWLRLPVILPTLALAAAVLIVVVPDQRPDEVEWHLEVQGGEAARRGTPSTGTAVYTKGSMITMVVRPDARTDDHHRVSLWIDGKPVQIKVTHEDGGAVTLTGVFGEDLPLLTPGPHQLQVNIDDHAYAHPFTWKDGG